MLSPILVHVGYPKTATTWLQNQLFNRQDLGYISPWGSQSGEAVDAFIICNPFRFDPIGARKVFIDGMADAAKRSLVPVLSNEVMCGDTKPGRGYEREVAVRLYQTFPQARILITIREQKAALLSHYRESIAGGNVHTIHEYFSKPWPKPGFAPPCRLEYFEYDLLVVLQATVW